MKKPRDPKRLADSEIAWNGVQPGLAIEFIILAGVKHVEARAPESHRSGQQQNSWIERAAGGDPGSRRCNPPGKPQHQMRPASKTFGVGVKQNYGQRERGKNERQPIELRGREDK